MARKILVHPLVHEFSETAINGFSLLIKTNGSFKDYANT